MTRFQVWLNVGGVGFLQADTLETEERAIEVARSIAKRCPHTNTGVYSVSQVHSFRHETEKKRPTLRQSADASKACDVCHGHRKVQHDGDDHECPECAGTGTEDPAWRASPMGEAFGTSQPTGVAQPGDAPKEGT